jgi:S-adenosylmethionine:tRNA ribosyltransferase-isomerase
MVDKKDYAYELPAEQIAKEPAVPRDRSRLFVYDTQTDKIELDHFDNLEHYLPSRSFLVLNETKVLPSRVTLHKATGGKIKVLFLVNEKSGNERQMRMMADRKTNVGDKLYFNQEDFVTVIKQDRQLFVVEFSFAHSRLEELLVEQGTMPIPLYIKNTPLSEEQLRQRYQTVFARTPGSSAAPTASLHFSELLLKKLAEKHIQKLFVTLHVGMGTFAPVSEEQIAAKKLHEEWFEVQQAVAEEIMKLKDKGDQLVAVGTTVVRTLESLALQEGWEKGRDFGTTNLFIYPPYRFHLVDHLITNFHLPESSLMMLVEAFLQSKNAKRRLVDLYKVAIAEKFRFYSFGDAMLIL